MIERIGDNVLTVNLPFRPASIKNSRKPMRIGHRMKFVKSDVAEAQTEHMQWLLRSAMRKQGHRGFGGNYFGMRVLHHVLTDTVSVDVGDLGAIRSRVGLMSDLQGIPESILDAFQKIAYDDDCQCRFLVAERLFP